MGTFLHKAFGMRMAGDYEEEAELTREDAQRILEYAEKFIASIEGKLKSGGQI
jgi:uncharacterized protein (UPF0332 family)